MDDNARYVFADIPNDDEGRAFIESLKKYFNKGRYKMRVRGQYMNDEARKSWRKYTHGAPKELCTHLRVYVDDAPRVRKRVYELRQEKYKRENTLLARAERLEREAQLLCFSLKNDCT
jgi:hypothetical protein